MLLSVYLNQFYTLIFIYVFLSLDSSAESMGELISAKFTHFENDDPDYPNMDGLTAQHVFVEPRPTKASLGNAAVAKERRERMNQLVCIDESLVSFEFVMLCELMSGCRRERKGSRTQTAICDEEISEYSSQSGYADQFR